MQMKLLQQLLTQESANTRFNYLLPTVMVCTTVTALVAAIIIIALKSIDGTEKFIEMINWTIGALLGGGVVGSGAAKYVASRKPGVLPPAEVVESETSVSKKVVKR